MRKHSLLLKRKQDQGTHGARQDDTLARRGQYLLLTPVFYLAKVPLASLLGQSDDGICLNGVSLYGLRHTTWQNHLSDPPVDPAVGVLVCHSNHPNLGFQRSPSPFRP